MANLDPFRSPELRALFIAKYDAVLAGWPVPYEEAEVPTSFGLSVPTTVVIGDREVIYGGGPEAALARAEACIPDVRTRLLPGAGHALTVDAPGALVDELRSALA